MSAGRNLIKWKSRRGDVPKRLEPSLSYAASVEKEGLDRFIIIIPEEGRIVSHQVQASQYVEKHMYFLEELILSQS